MSILNPKWQQGRILPSEDKNVLREYICYGCSVVCRTTTLAHDPPPTECLHPDLLQRQQEIRDDVDTLFKHKIHN